MPTSVCPICGDDETGVYSVKDGRELRICNNCRHIYWAIMPDNALLMRYYADEYTESHGQHDIQQGHRDYYRSHVQELARLTRTQVERLAIADVGCSIPVFLEEAVALGATKAIGVDWSAEARAYGADHHVQVITPDDMMATIPDGSLDVLRYSHTLEHLIDPVATLSAHVRKVRPDGLVYITQPNIPIFRFAPSVTDIHDSVWPRHLHFFSPLSALYLGTAAELSLEQLFTVADEEIAQRNYQSDLDLDYARDRLATTKSKGDIGRGPLNNYPYFLGFNATLYLRKGAPRTKTPPDWLRRIVRRLRAISHSVRPP